MKKWYERQEEEIEDISNEDLNEEIEELPNQELNEENDLNNLSPEDTDLKTLMGPSTSRDRSMKPLMFRRTTFEMNLVHINI